MVSALTAFIFILIFAFGIYGVTNLKSAFTPLLSVMVLMDIVMVFAMTGRLKAGVYAACILSAVVFGFALYKNKTDLKEKLQSFFSAGVLLFMGASALMLMVLYATQPVIHGWDEFSFWGTAAKLVDKYDALYTYHNSSMLGQSIPPSMIVLGYFFGFFDGVFTEWIVYFAYDVLFFACFAAFCAAFGKKHSHSRVMMFITAFIIPFLFEITEINSKLYSTYISAYGDIPLGLAFAGALAVYFLSDENNSRDILPVIPVLVFLTLIKDMGFALSCIVVFVAFFDMLVGREKFVFLKLKGFFAKCAAAFVLLCATVFSYVGWSMHIGKVLNINRSDFSESTSVGMVEMLISGVLELISPDKSKKFSQISGSMISAFFNTKVSMFGAGVVVVAVITAVFALSFILSDKKGKKRTIMMYLTTWTGFIGYYVFHLFLYVYVFKNDAYILPSYDRYMYIYYIGWLLAGLFCLCLAVKEGHSLLAQAGLVTFGLCTLAIFNLYADVDNTFMGVNSNSFPKRELIGRKADFLRDAIGGDDVIYVASEDNSGEHWFIYSYELLDNFMPQSYFVWTEGTTEEDWDEMAPAEMTKYFKANKVTHILVDNVNQQFVKRYGDLFDEPVDEIGLNYVAYYKVDYSGDVFRFNLVKGGGA